MRFLGVTSILFVVVGAAATASADNEICTVTSVDGSVENGVGAEPGVVREFVQDVDVPSRCQTLSGKTWVLAHELRVTRVSPSSPTVPAWIGVREIESAGDSQPGQIFIEAQFVEVNSPLFPEMGIEWTIFSGAPRATGAGNVAPTVAFDGDLTANQFGTVDQSPATPQRTCWTRGSGLDWLDCTAGNPNLRGIGLSLRVSPTVARVPALDPFATIFSDVTTGAEPINIDFSGVDPGFDLIESVEVVEPSNPNPICSSPGIFPFECSLSVQQQALHRQSQLLILITPRIVPPRGERQTVIEAQLISADHYVFSNGFEGGDGSMWSAFIP
jgi:hypothetical protein